MRGFRKGVFCFLVGTLKNLQPETVSGYSIDASDTFSVFNRECRSLSIAAFRLREVRNMSSLAVLKRSDDYDPRCADLTALAERELSAFFNALLNGCSVGRAEDSAKDWLHELIEIEGSAHLRPRMAVHHYEGYGTAGKSAVVGRLY